MIINFIISRSQTALVFIAHTRASSEIIHAITQKENILSSFGSNLDFSPSCSYYPPDRMGTTPLGTIPRSLPETPSSVRCLGVTRVPARVPVYAPPSPRVLGSAKQTHTELTLLIQKRCRELHWRRFFRFVTLAARPCDKRFHRVWLSDGLGMRRQEFSFPNLFSIL